MVGRIQRAADFQRVLACSAWSRSTHFALHHLPERPSAVHWVLKKQLSTELSTGDSRSCPPIVDDLPTDSLLTAVPTASADHAPGRWLLSSGPPAVVDKQWLGLVVPKRHARRSVTRSLIKRQMRAAMADGGARLPGGLWVMRLKQAFDVRQFPSAASSALRVAVHDELRRVLQRAVSRSEALEREQPHV